MNKRATMFQATEAIMFCRGKMMEDSEEFSMDKMVSYLHKKMPYMRTKNEIKGFN
jgi:hypothetical protein